MYRKGEVGAPDLFDPKWLPPIPHEPKIDVEAKVQDASKPLKRVRIEDLAQDEPALSRGPPKRRVLGIRENEMSYCGSLEAYNILGSDDARSNRHLSKDTAAESKGYKPPVPLMRNLLNASSTRRDR